MDTVQQAMVYFSQGCNCAQAVLAAFGQRFGLSEDQCLQLGGAFGGGIARRGEICGAVSGALMVLGLKDARSPIGNPNAKDEVYAAAQTFINNFCESHGSVICKELLGCDLGTPEGRALARQNSYHTTRCQNFIRTAVEILEKS